MKKVLAILLLVCQGMAAQAVVFLERNDTITQKPKYQEFIYLNDNMDLSGSLRVGKIKAVGSQDNPVLLYDMIKTEAQKAGANSFKLDHFDKFPDETAELTIDVYFTNDSILGVNFKTIEKNRAYIFGSRNLLDTKSQSCKVNGKKYDIQPGHYVMFPVLPGENLEIRKGSIGGTVMDVKGEPGKPSRFYSLTGFEITGADSHGNDVGVNFSTGDVNRIEQNFGLLLVKMFEEQR